VTEQLRIGELAARCGVTRDTIRFYERTGLLGTPSRSASDHRIYDSKAVERVRFVRQLQGCGLMLADIHKVVQLGRTDGAAASRSLLEIMRFRLGFLEERIAGLGGCTKILKSAIRRCAAAKSNGYATLAKLPQGDSAPAFRFGRRGSA
jgi:DNA-binding transcriptional MerR regulator